jgi:hypothetical protein
MSKAEASVDVYATERKTMSRRGCETDKKDTRDGGDGARYMSIVNQHRYSRRLFSRSALH